MPILTIKKKISIDLEESFKKVTPPPPTKWRNYGNDNYY